jgi:hypothetical protein
VHNSTPACADAQHNIYYQWLVAAQGTELSHHLGVLEEMEFGG